MVAGSNRRRLTVIDSDKLNDIGGDLFRAVEQDTIYFSNYISHFTSLNSFCNEVRKFKFHEVNNMIYTLCWRGTIPAWWHVPKTALNLPQTYAYVWNPRLTLYTAGNLHTAVPHCSHSRAPNVHMAMPQENNEHGRVHLRCMAVCKLPGCEEGHPLNLSYV